MQQEGTYDRFGESRSPVLGSLIDSGALDALVGQHGGLEDETALIPSHLYARLRWMQENQQKKERELLEKQERKYIRDMRARDLHEKVQAGRAARAGRSRAAVEQAQQHNSWLAAEERRIQEEDEALRQAQQRELMEQVRKRREMAQGKVAASRNNLQEQNRRHRREEAVREQFALDEKARRLAKLQEQHRKALAKKYVPVSASEIGRSPSFRLLHHNVSGMSRPSTAPNTPTYRPAISMFPED